jgi:hydroxyacylglutathione hydrolase
MGTTPYGENRLPIEGVRLPLAGATPELGVLLLDVRSPAAFASGFIPGSFHFPDAGCLELLRTNGLIKGSRALVVAEAPEEIDRCRETLTAGLELEFGGVCGPNVIEDWRRRYGDLGSLEMVEADTLAVRVSAWKTLVVDTRSRAAFERARIREALHIPPDNLTDSLAGLPPDTVLCVVCESGKRASFVASVVWNLGFRNVSFLKGGFAAYLESRLPFARG